MTETSPSAPAPVLAGVLETAAQDLSVRPQDDLFRHVNGAWLATAQIPADRPATGAFTQLRDEAELACRQIVEECAGQVSSGAAADGSEQAKIGALYATFMDEARIEALGAEPLRAELEPVLRAASKEELARLLGARLAIGFTGPVSVGVEVDLNDPERYTTWMGQSGLALPDESYYREESQAELRQAYVEHVAAMLRLAGVVGDLATGDAPGSREAGTAPDVDAATAVAQRVMAVETALAAGHWDRVRLRDIEQMNNPMTWAEAATGSFPWLQWLKGVEQAVRGADCERGTFLEELIVGQPDYLPHMGQVWESTSLEDLRAWVVWHVVHVRASLLSSAFVEENFAFYGKRLQGTDELRPRWKRGVGLVESCLGEAVGRIYVERHFPASHKDAMEVLVADLIEAYRQSISTLDWMSQETRGKALEKLSLFTPKIGYPKKFRDYSAVTVTAGDLLASVRSVEQVELAREVNRLGGPVDRDEWHMTPQTVNAYYNPTMNEIVFPAAILQPPFFDPQADAAVNYAGIGAVIGHEIGHGFDDQGSTFDGTGKVTDWWTEADREAFKERTGALIAQYDAYSPASLVARAAKEGDASKAPHVNGSLTIGENIGDLGGLGIALKAYRLALAREGLESEAQAPVIDGLSAMQRFFFSWARIWRGKNRDDYAELLLTIDPHSPAEFRCNGIVRNLDAFYEAFDVHEGDALWLAPQERVSIW
ncbi:M13 family metallopeptidase [Actinomyces weissii]|uniref:Peptidase M13 n=1 Tax=Actinomyces weissii TaxID=675090 RepID=A0A7T7M8I6_9ACTO|nr:M13-type metalloendopeptidase [Actinomyces weissii]QQM66845.1 peptidase M13 [Actinomyces weissii]